MRTDRVIVILAVAWSACVCSSVGLSAEKATSWSLDDAIRVLETHFQQISDVQYSYRYRMVPVAEPSYADSYEVNVKWVPKSDWEKRQVKSSGNTYMGRTTRQVDAWNGEVNQMREAAGQAGKPEQKLGRVASHKPSFATLEPMILLNMRDGAGRTMADLLRRCKVEVRGEETIDGRTTLGIFCNEAPDLPASESLVWDFWLDLARGGIPLRAEMRVRGKLSRVVDGVKISEVKPGIFFPVALRCRTFGGPPSNGVWIKGEETIFEVDPKSVNFNQQLAKKDFLADFEPGLAIWNDDLDFGFYAGGRAPTDTIDPVDLSRLAQLAAKDYRESRGNPGRRSSGARWLQWSLVFCAVCAIIGIALWRRRRLAKRAGILLIFTAAVAAMAMRVNIARGQQQESPQRESCCGVNSIFILLQIEGLRPDLERIIAMPGIQQKMPDLALLDLQAIAHEFGHDVFAARMPWQDVPRLRRPFIAQVRLPGFAEGHFVTCWSIGNSQVHVVDYPKHGAVALSRFAELFTGYVLIAETEKQGPPMEWPRSDMAAPGKSVIASGNVGRPPPTSQPTGPSEAQDGRPRLTWIDQPSRELGTVQSPYPFRGSYQFRFRNDGSQALQINRIVSSCGCVDAKLTTRSVSSGETATLSVDLSENRGGPFNERVLLETNAVNAQQQVVRVSGRIAFAHDAIVVPMHCQFELPATETDTVIRTLALYSWADGSGKHELLESEGHLEGDVASLLEIRGETGWSRIPQQTVRSGMMRAFRVRLAGAPEPGNYKGAAAVKYGDRVFRVPIVINVKPPVIAEPATCLITPESANAVRSIQLRSPLGVPVRVTSVEASALWIDAAIQHYGSSDTTGRAEAAEVRIRVKERPPGDGHLARAEVRVCGDLGHRQWSAAIPVLYVMP